MPKDYANIYNLTEAEREFEKKDLWKDSVPGTEELAKNILRKIEKDEYPYVLSVEAGYGMGKTYFFSRFCEQAIKDGFDCIYMSAWENDYQPSPFCFIAKEIIQCLALRTEPIVKSKIDKLAKKGLSAVKKILSVSQLQLGMQTHNVSAGISVDVGKLITSKDEIKEFKKELEQILVSNKIKPLILVIDELDRCRPDYALKTLEIIKHFFDIDNLYVILPINKEAMNDMVTAVYGQMQNSENYLKKLITQNIMLPQPDAKYYEKIAKTILTEQKLKNQLKQKYIEKNGTYNGFNLISECIGQYALAGKLTYRETVKVCSEFTSIINQIKDKIHIEYLAYKLCQKHSKTTITLNTNHPFYEMTNSYNKTNKRAKVLSIEGLSVHTHGISSRVNRSLWHENYTQKMRAWERSDNFSTYKELYEFINQVNSIKEDLLRRNLDYDTTERLKWIFDAVEKKDKEAKEYQIKYGSDDKDTEKQAYYDKVVYNPLLVYAPK